MVYCNPHIAVYYDPLYTLNIPKQLGFFSLLTLFYRVQLDENNSDAFMFFVGTSATYHPM